MKRDLKRLAGERFDLLVIGGGVNGLAIAWDASLRGLAVAVIDRGDFGAETSSGSLKIIHGGLRYLQHLDLVRMRRSIRQRSSLMRIAPHLIRPLPFLVPAYGHGVKGLAAMATASRLNDWISADRNRWLTPLGRALPDGRVLSRREALDRVPGLEPAGLTGGVIFYDGQMESAERVTLSFGLGAATRGAAVANHVEAVRLLTEGARVVGAEAEDRLTGDRFQIRARCVVSAAGPWNDLLVRPLEGETSRSVMLSKGFQVITPALTGELGLAVVSRHRDPDAVIHRGGRHYFIAPWRGHSIIGNTDEVFQGDPDDWRITEAEIEDFLGEVNRAFPGAGLDRGAVRHAYGGLQAIDRRRIGTGALVAKKHRLVRDRPGLVRVTGVKYTGCRWLAEKAVDLACAELGYTADGCVTARAPLPGGDIGSVESLARRIRAASPDGLPEPVQRHLSTQYGTQFVRVLKLMKEHPEWASCLPGSDEVTAAEVVYAVRHEAAVRLADVVMRRTDLGTLGHPGADALRACAGLMAEELGWDAARVEAEIEAVEAGYRFG